MSIIRKDNKSARAYKAHQVAGLWFLDQPSTIHQLSCKTTNTEPMGCTVCPFTSVFINTKLYCLVTEAAGCDKLV